MRVKPGHRILFSCEFFAQRAQIKMRDAVLCQSVRMGDQGIFLYL